MLLDCIAALAVSSDGRAGAMGTMPSSTALLSGSGIATGRKRSSETLYWFAMVQEEYFHFLWPDSVVYGLAFSETGDDLVEKLAKLSTKRVVWALE